MAAITTAAIGAGSAIYSIASAEKSKKEAKDAISDFDSQDLTNPFIDTPISTLRAEQQTEANNLNLSTSVEALRGSGVRGAVGGIPRVNQASNLLQSNISSDLERQDTNRSLLIAQGEERIRAIRENREQLALQGLGQQLQTARQDSVTGLTNLVSSGLALSSALGEPAPRQKQKKASKIKQKGSTFDSFPNLQPTTSLF